MTLSTRALTLTVPGRTLVSGLDVQIAPGQCWAILGENGSGKSRLLLALAGLRKPASGDVQLDGTPLAARPRRELAREVGILLQEEPEVFWGSVLDYVLLGAFPHGRLAPGGAPDAAAREALAATDLAGHALQPYRTLSGGERQRARIAQLLVQSPAHVLLDEPLNHLDLRHQIAAMETFAALARSGRAVAMALHEPWLAARYCDHALLLYDSTRFSAGPSSELLAREALERLYGCPFDAFADPGSRPVPIDRAAHTS